MEAPKLKKTKFLRRRFIKSAAALSSLNDWSDSLLDLKRKIQNESAFQIVGEKGIIEVDSKSGLGHVMIEVVGVPKSGIHHQDQEAGSVLIYELPESAFDVDFLTVKQVAAGLLSRIPGKVGSTYHIVVKGHHLALHFFI